MHGCGGGEEASGFRLPDIGKSWSAKLGGELDLPRMRCLEAFLSAEILAGKTLYDATPLGSVRAVIIAQDPYIRQGQAHGLALSVPRGVRKPPSLRNVLRELSSDLGIPEPEHGCLERWALQGVLLLNTVLTVEEGKSGSHSKRGWEAFTDRVVEAVDSRPGHVAFLLWGDKARAKAAMVDRSRHLVHESAHPSPLARGAFFGSKPFSAANAFLSSRGVAPIDWRLD